MKKNYIGIIFIILISVFFFRLNSRIFKRDIEVGDYLKVYGKVDACILKVITIDNKYPRNNMYMNINKIRDGYTEIEGEVESIKENRWGKGYNLNVIEEKRKEKILKNYFIKKISRVTENYSLELENFYKAVILGEGELIETELKEKFRYTGTSHVLVISGLHIGIIISGILFVLLKANIKKQMRYSITLLIITIYIFSVGFTPSIFRAYIMGSIFLLGNIFYEKSSSKKNLILSFIISLLIFPEWIYSLSFWMSYTAVFSIIIVYPKIPKITKFRYNYTNKILNSLVFMLTIQLCMTPILFIYFKNLPLFSFLGNFIIVPVATLFILSAFLTLFLSNFYLEFLLSPLVNIIYIVLIKLVSIVAQIPYLTLEF